MTQDQAIDQIGAPIIQACSTSWKNAWDDIRGQFNHPDFDNRTRSSLLQALAVIHARALLQNFGVEYVCDETQHIFIIPNVARIIFKKLDEDRKPIRNRTERTRALFQSTLFDDYPTLVVGMATAYDWADIIGIYLYSPRSNAAGNSWTLEITDGIVAIDEGQASFIPLLEETEFDETTTETKPQPKFKPKYDPNIGEGEEEAGSGGNIGN
jgi:hypothetical protein